MHDIRPLPPPQKQPMLDDAVCCPKFPWPSPSCSHGQCWTPLTRRAAYPTNQAGWRRHTRPCAELPKPHAVFSVTVYTPQCFRMCTSAWNHTKVSCLDFELHTRPPFPSSPALSTPCISTKTSPRQMSYTYASHTHTPLLVGTMYLITYSSMRHKCNMSWFKSSINHQSRRVKS